MHRSSVTLPAASLTTSVHVTRYAYRSGSIILLTLRDNRPLVFFGIIGLVVTLLGTAAGGFVFSHWTWLPPLRKQWALSGERFTAQDGNVVARLLTPLDVPYAEAYARTYPFDKVVPTVAESDQARRMVLDAVALAFRAEAADATLSVIANNRAWGNAPELAKTIALRILEEEERRASGGDQTRP